MLFRGNMVYESVEDFRNSLENAIEEAMTGRLLDFAKLEIQNAEESIVYSYPPKFNSRRRIAGGIQDTENMTHSYDALSHTLTITVDAPWQNLNRGGKPATSIGAWLQNSLTDVIENNQMYGAPPRPFAKEAEERIQSKMGEAELVSALAYLDL